MKKFTGIKQPISTRIRGQCDKSGFIELICLGICGDNFRFVELWHEPDVLNTHQVYIFTKVVIYVLTTLLSYVILQLADDSHSDGGKTCR